MNGKRICLLLTALCLLVVSCKKKKTEEKEDEVYDYPITIIQDTLAVNVLDAPLKHSEK